MSSATRKLALVLEDEPIIAMGLSMQLRDAGFAEIETFSDCATALSYLRKPDALLPDISILDVQLKAGQTSLEVAQFLQDRGALFFLLSGHGDDNVLTASLPNVRAMSKPVSDEALFALIDETLAGDNVT